MNAIIGTIISFVLIIAISLGIPAYDIYIRHGDDPSYAKTRAAAIEHERAAKAQEIAKVEAQTLKNCAIARAKHEQMFKAGVAHPEEQVDVRAACEPGAVEAEANVKWIFIGLALVIAFFALPLLFMGMAPG